MLSLRTPLIVLVAATLISGCASNTTQARSDLEISQPHTSTPAESSQDTPYERRRSPYPDLIRPASDLTLAIHEEQSATEVGAATSLERSTVLRLHIEDCRILEAEPRTASNEDNLDCREFNQHTFDGRRQRALRVPAGRVQIYIYNKGAIEETGFWLRKQGEDPETIASTGGITKDSPQVLDVNLSPGHYLYSSPVNPTPDYLLIVEP
jgi:hypothetical protein